jgi:hypothetical protein
MKIMQLLGILAVAFTLYAAPTSDYGKEQRWATQVEDGLMDGDVVWLDANNHQFMGLYTESEEESSKAVIVVHGIGIHPDWKTVIQPLRVGLAERGLHTLSIQMPVLANGVEGKEYIPLFADAGQRIAAAVQYLKKQGLTADILVAHSLGSVMSAYHLSTSEHQFNKFVAIGMGSAGVKYLSGIDITTLDLYGKSDLDSVRNSAQDRKKAMQHNAHYTQKQITGNHFFADHDELLVETVYHWLQK